MRPPVRLVIIVVAACLAGAGIAAGVALSGTGPSHTTKDRPSSADRAPTRSPSHQKKQTPTTTTLSTSPPPSATSTTSSPPANSTTTLVTLSVPVVTCPTTFGTAGGKPSTAPSVPQSVTVSVPSSLQGYLAVYSDSADRMNLLGPAGWTCKASYGADGSGAVAVSPPGASTSNTKPLYDTQPFTASTAEAIVGVETGGCALCTEAQACPLFASAASAYQHNYGSSCQRTRPSAESMSTMSPSVVKFSDPPGVAGDGAPSGGHYSAIGVMTYVTGKPSWRDTCTLPSSDGSLCSAATSNFAANYGSL